MESISTERKSRRGSRECFRMTETTICEICQKLVYVGFVEQNRFLFCDSDLQHAHTRKKCESNQKNNGLESSVKTLQDQVLEIKEQILEIRGKIGLD